MTTEQTAINHRALMAAAAKVERLGYDGDPFTFVEGLVLSVLADGYHRLEPIPPRRGQGASRDAIEAARAACREAVQSAKERRKKPAEETA